MNKEAGGKVVEIGRLAYDMSDFQSRYEPGPPAADEHGYVRYPNVNSLVEAMDMNSASASMSIGPKRRSPKPRRPPVAPSNERLAVWMGFATRCRREVTKGQAISAPQG